MLKKAFLIVFVLIIAGFAPLIAQNYETLAVLDFTTEAVSEIEMKAIVEFLSAELFKTKKYTVIDVSQRETILKEMEFSMSGCSDDSCALEIGKMLSAELIVTGNLSKVGSRYLMSVKMLETETSKTMGTANGKFTDLDKLIDGLEPIASDLAGIEAPVKVAETEKPVDDSEIVDEEVTKEAVAIIEEPEIDPESEKDKGVFGGGSMVGSIAFTAGGVAAMGAGGYFLYDLFTNSLPSYNDADYAYGNAYGEAEYTDLYNASANAYDEAMLDLIIGASAVGVGAILTTIGIILFPSSSEDGSTVSFSPILTKNPGMLVRVSY